MEPTEKAGDLLPVRWQVLLNVAGFCASAAVGTALFCVLAATVLGDRCSFWASLPFVALAPLLAFFLGPPFDGGPAETLFWALWDAFLLLAFLPQFFRRTKRRVFVAVAAMALWWLGGAACAIALLAAAAAC